MKKIFLLLALLGIVTGCNATGNVTNAERFREIEKHAENNHGNDYNTRVTLALYREVIINNPNMLWDEIVTRVDRITNGRK